MPSYDADGNATAYPVPTAPSANASLTWDGENRLVSVVAGTPALTTTYFYDALSRRIAKTTGGNTTAYVYDGWNLIAEYTGETLTRTYTWGMDLSGSMQGAGGIGGLLAVGIPTGQSNPGSYYPTYDGNGNVSEYLDSSGTVQAHYEYDPFGNTPVSNETMAASFLHRFSTKPLDGETGLYYYGYRWYDPVTGRWPSRDRIEEDGGINLYGFVDNDGVNHSDMLGEVLTSCRGPSGYCDVSWDCSLARIVSLWKGTRARYEYWCVATGVTYRGGISSGCPKAVGDTMPESDYTDFVTSLMHPSPPLAKRLSTTYAIP